MLNVVIFGAPGSGKGTQSELIIKEYGLDHISTGDVLLRLNWARSLRIISRRDNWFRTS